VWGWSRFQRHEKEFFMKKEQDKGKVSEIFISCNERILDRIEAVPEAVVKRSTVRTHLDHFIAQVQV
jgi:hypothetical protein